MTGWQKPDWRMDKVTTEQMSYIGMMTKNYPDLPPFTGSTKGEAAVYIEKYRKYGYRKINKGDVS